MSDIAEPLPWERTDWTGQEIRQWNSGIIDEFRTNAGKVGGPYEGGDLLLLTTTGAKTGRQHTVPLAYQSEGDRLVVSSLADTAYPAWFHNLKAYPTVTVELGATTFEATANAVMAGPERERLWAWVLRTWPLLVEHQAKTSLLVPLVVLERQLGGV
jgi:deazaflavin-dependent oxidoreductase (nitroreductase family)